ncbi:unnamed protein product [Arabis nemorensis]|uniref:Uncharacterized protein n=1 Tax=Arabis nemorensis TaxID=586526 RepID=A0A565B949_9BRAS|nr:unnamed protein product [Arabis nemorensis]
MKTHEYATSYTTDIEDISDEFSVDLIVKMPKIGSQRKKVHGFVTKQFKFRSMIPTTNMNLFNFASTVEKYKDPLEIIQKFYNFMLDQIAKEINDLHTLGAGGDDVDNMNKKRRRMSERKKKKWYTETLNHQLDEKSGRMEEFKSEDDRLVEIGQGLECNAREFI